MLRGGAMSRPVYHHIIRALPLLLLVVLASAPSIVAAAAAGTSGAAAPSPRRRGHAPLFAFSSPTSPDPSPSKSSSIPLIDRVPTFRLYQGGACVQQLRGNGEVQECRQRLHEAIMQLLPSGPAGRRTKAAAVAPILELDSPAALDALLARQQQQQQQQQEEEEEEEEPQPEHQEDKDSATSKGSSSATPPKPVYKDRAALIQALMSQPSAPPPAPAPAATGGGTTHGLDDDDEAGALLLIVEFYGRNCKQCRLMDPMFDSLPFAYRGKPLAFARADVTRFPALVVPPPVPETFAGLDRTAGIDERLEGCPRCGGGGFVECEACGGKGHVVRSVEQHTVADVCMACVGHKKVPCPQCGGKCYLC